MKFLSTMLAVCAGVILAANVKPVMDYGSRRLAIKILNARAVQEAERRAARA